MAPSGLNTADLTAPSWPCSTASCCPLDASQSRAVRSSEAVATLAPSGLNAADLTAPSWPCSAASCCPLAASQSRAVRSSEAVTTLVPSGLNAADMIAPSWPCRTASCCPLERVPEPRRSILRGGQHPEPVRVERRRHDAFPVAPAAPPARDAATPPDTERLPPRPRRVDRAWPCLWGAPRARPECRWSYCRPRSAAPTAPRGTATRFSGPGRALLPPLLVAIATPRCQ